MEKTQADARPVSPSPSCPVSFPVGGETGSVPSPEGKSIHEGHRARMRERFLKSGLDDFAPHEVLEMLLGYVVPRRDTNDLAHRLIQRFGSLSAVLDAERTELLAVPGMGEQCVTFLKMLPAVFRFYASDKTNGEEPMDTVGKIGDFLHARYTGIPFERVYLLLFNNRMNLIDCCLIGDGAVNCSAVTVRKIAELCLFNHASSAVLAHNHPRGLPIPSSADLEVTRTVECALEAIGVQLLEHMIVTEYSVAPILRSRKGILRASPISGRTDEDFFRKFYGEEMNA